MAKEMKKIPWEGEFTLPGNSEEVTAWQTFSTCVSEIVLLFLNVSETQWEEEVTAAPRDREEELALAAVHFLTLLSSGSCLVSLKEGRIGCSNIPSCLVSRFQFLVLTAGLKS